MRESGLFSLMKEVHYENESLLAGGNVEGLAEGEGLEGYSYSKH